MPSPAVPLCFALLASASALACSPSPAPDPLADPPIPPRYATFAAAFDQERESLGAPGAAVALIEDGKVTFAHGFGTRSATDLTPVRARSLFRIASLTKALTSTALLSLVQEGSVSLDTPFTSIVPDVDLASADLGSLTLRQLLSHQSGLFDFFPLTGPTDDAALSQYLTGPDFGQTEYFMDPPGSFWNYSNPNFFLAGLALERGGGAAYRQAMSARVFTKLGMTRTFFLPSEVLADGDYAIGKAESSYGGPPSDVTPDAYDNAAARPAGLAFSNVLDYAKFVSFLQTGDSTVLSDEERAAMQTSQVDTHEMADVEGYGFGVVVDQPFLFEGTDYPVKVIHHDGDLSGYAADFYLVPSTGFGIVAFASADNAHFGTSLAYAFQSFAGLPAPSAVPSSLLGPAPSLGAFAGTYLDPNDVGEVIVTASKGSLSVSIPQLDAADIPYSSTLQPGTGDSFALLIDDEGVIVTFLPDSSGTYVWLRTRGFVAQREAEPEDAGGADVGPEDAGDASDQPGDASADSTLPQRHFDAHAFLERLHAPR